MRQLFHDFTIIWRFFLYGTRAERKRMSFTVNRTQRSDLSFQGYLLYVYIYIGCWLLCCCCCLACSFPLAQHFFAYFRLHASTHPTSREYRSFPCARILSGRRFFLARIFTRFLGRKASLFFRLWVALLTPNARIKDKSGFAVFRYTHTSAHTKLHQGLFTYTRTYTGAHSERGVLARTATGPLKSQANDLDAHRNRQQRKMVMVAMRTNRQAESSKIGLISTTSRLIT